MNAITEESIVERDPGSGERSLFSAVAGCQRKLRTQAGIAGPMKLLRWILQSAFGCRHGHLSRVFTIKRRTYQVCYDCGCEFEYSWPLMRSVQSDVAENAYAPLDGAEPADVSVS